MAGDVPTFRIYENMYRSVSSDDLRRNGFVFHPLGAFCLYWNYMMIVCVILVALTGPLDFAVAEWSEYGVFGWQFERALAVVFMLDIAINFNTAVAQKADDFHAVFVFDRRTIARQYLKLWFWIDVLAVVPFNLIIEAFSSPRTIKVLRLLRLYRMLKIARRENTQLHEMWENFLDALENLGAFKGFAGRRLMGSGATVVTVIFVQAHYVACLLLALDGWAYRSTPALNLLPFKRYLTVLRWSLSSLSIGFIQDDLLDMEDVPAFDFIHIAVLAVRIFNIGLTMWVFSGIETSIWEVENLEVIRHVMLKTLRSCHIDKSVRTRVDMFMQHQAEHMVNKVVNKGMQSLSNSLRREVSLGLNRPFIRHFPLFSSWPFSVTTFPGELACILNPCWLAPGEQPTVRGGHVAGMFYLIVGKITTDENETTTSRTRTINSEKSDRRSANILLHKFAKVGKRESFDHSRYFGVAALFCLKGQVEAETSVTCVSYTETLCLMRADFDNLLERYYTMGLFVAFVQTLVAEGKLDLLTLAYEGLTDDMMADFGKGPSRSAHPPSSEELGVSLVYLTDDVHQDVTSAIRIVNGQHVRNPTFKDIERVCWGGACPGFHLTKSVNCPRDSKKGCAIVDTLNMRFPEKTLANRATHYLSWFWGYAVDCIASGLAIWARRYLGTNKKNEIFVWMCFFCNNQHRILEALANNESTETDLEKIFVNRLKMIKQTGCVIAVLDNYEHPGYIKRLWCIYETYKAKELGLRIVFVLPAKGYDELYHDVVNGNLQVLADSLANLKSELAKASFEADETRIRAAISSTIGFDAVDTVVRASLSDWFANTFVEVLANKNISEATRYVFQCIDSDRSGHASLYDLRDCLTQHSWLREFTGFNADIEALRDHFGNGGGVSAKMFDSFLRARYGAALDASFIDLLRENHAKPIEDQDKALISMRSEWIDNGNEAKKNAEATIGRVCAELKRLGVCSEFGLLERLEDAPRSKMFSF